MLGSLAAHLHSMTQGVSESGLQNPWLLLTVILMLNCTQFWWYEERCLCSCLEEKDFVSEDRKIQRLSLCLGGEVCFKAEVGLFEVAGAKLTVGCASFVSKF